MFLKQNWLLSNSAIEEKEKQDILEVRLLPLAGKKQKEFEDYLDQVEVRRFFDSKY